MNDLDLHRRLSDLADGLSPEADPLTEVATARSMHHRRRRNRIAIAGAALAVALVAVGVPTAVDTLSAPERRDVAAPTTSRPPSEGPEGAAEQLRPWVDALRAAAGERLTDDAAPDPERALPCPDVADALSRTADTLTVEPSGINAGGGTLTGCGWSSDGTGRTPAEQRLDLSLRAAFDTTTDDVLRELDDRVTDDGCAWTTLGGKTFDPVVHCTGPQETWALTVVHPDGEGAWVFTAAVGSELQEPAAIGAGGIAELWRAVAGSAGPAAEPAISALNSDHIRVVDTLTTRPPDLTAPAEPASCPEATAQLSDAVSAVLVRQDSDDADHGCGWTTTDLRADRLSLGMAFLRTADEAVLEMIIDENAKAGTGQDDAAEHPGTCLSSDLTDTPRRTTVQACSVAGRGTQWTVLSDVGGGAGLWQLTVIVPADEEDDVDDADAVLALVDVAETAW